MNYEDISTFKQICLEQSADVVHELFLPNDVVWDIRASHQCRTCSRYGHNANCPPNVPDTEYFKKLFSSYTYGLLVGKILKYSNPDEYGRARSNSSKELHEILIELERQGRRRGHYWITSFIGGSCRHCLSCDGSRCRMPEYGRIPVEATGIDIVETCKRLNIDITRFPEISILDGSIHRVGILLIA